MLTWWLGGCLLGGVARWHVIIQHFLLALTTHYGFLTHKESHLIGPCVRPEDISINEVLITRALQCPEPKCGHVEMATSSVRLWSLWSLWSQAHRSGGVIVQAAAETAPGRPILVPCCSQQLIRKYST